MAERLILVGRVAGAFGVRGELRLTAFTAEPVSMVSYGPLRRADGSIALTPEGGRAVKGAVVARAREVASREAAQALRGLDLYIERSALPGAEADEFYFADLVGLAAVSPAGARLGKVKAVADFGAGDLLEIAPEDGGPSWWAPFTHAIAPRVDLAAGLIVIDRPAEVEDGEPQS